MPSLTTLYKLPISSHYFDHAEYCSDILHYEYLSESSVVRGGIRFERVPTYRFRAERCMELWQYDASDKLVEVEDSEWVRQIRADTDRVIRDREIMNHYAIYLQIGGTYEVIARSFEVLPEEKGSWPRILAK
jgi:hypothetical protein